jgi:hypothetical protein
MRWVLGAGHRYACKGDGASNNKGTTIHHRVIPLQIGRASKQACLFHAPVAEPSRRAFHLLFQNPRALIDSENTTRRKEAGSKRRANRRFKPDGDSRVCRYQYTLKRR